MFDIEKEISAVVSNDLLDSLLFYGQEYREYPEHREKIFKEFEKQAVILIRKVKKELDENDEDFLSYYRIDCNNGFCGCEETFYVALPQDIDIDEYAKEVLENEYSFYEPDGRFIPDKNWGDDITEEEDDNYMEDVSVDWEEITREEYENHE